MGSQINMAASGGSVDVTWQVSSVTVPLSRVELVVNGEIRESEPAGPEHAKRHGRVQVDKSAWLALLVRGHYEDKPEIDRGPFFAGDGLVWHGIRTAGSGRCSHHPGADRRSRWLSGHVGTRAEDQAYKRMRMVLEWAYRSLHNRMHQAGQFHDHGLFRDHPEG